MYRKLFTFVLTLLFAIVSGQKQVPLSPEGMVLIPAGTLMMGSDEGQRIAAPRHPVQLHAFYMDSHEVTNREYHDYCMATGNKLPEFWGMDVYKSGLNF